MNCNFKISIDCTQVLFFYLRWLNVNCNALVSVELLTVSLLAGSGSLICGRTGEVQAKAVPAATAPRHTTRTHKIKTDEK